MQNCTQDLVYIKIKKIQYHKIFKLIKYIFFTAFIEVFVQFTKTNTPTHHLNLKFRLDLEFMY